MPAPLAGIGPTIAVAVGEVDLRTRFPFVVSVPEVRLSRPVMLTLLFTPEGIVTPAALSISRLDIVPLGSV